MGRISLNNKVHNGELPKDEKDGNFIGGNHHMGGTRMSNDSKSGVVDENLKVWGINNLYVCGSSIFPRGGTCNPTLSIIQLTLGWEIILIKSYYDNKKIFYLICFIFFTSINFFS